MNRLFLLNTPAKLTRSQETDQARYRPRQYNFQSGRISFQPVSCPNIYENQPNRYRFQGDSKSATLVGAISIGKRLFCIVFDGFVNVIDISWSFYFVATPLNLGRQYSTTAAIAVTMDIMTAGETSPNFHKGDPIQSFYLEFSLDTIKGLHFSKRIVYPEDS